MRFSSRVRSNFAVFAPCGWTHHSRLHAALQGLVAQTLVCEANWSSPYTGGANPAVQVTKDTIYGKITEIKTKLDQNKIPASERFLVMPSEITNLLLQSGSVTPAVDAAYEEVVKRGLVGTIGGFQLYSNEQVSGDTTNGWHCLAGHKSAITFYSPANIEKSYQRYSRL